MKLAKLLLPFVLSVLMIVSFDTAYKSFHRIVLGKSSYSTEAIYKIPNSSVEIVLERRAIHLFLAEYERTLVLRISKKEIIRKEVAADTGGYSRMNVYFISPSEYFLCGNLSHDKFYLDIQKRDLSEANEEKPKEAKFLGSFDRDQKGWRFIPVLEREEQTSKF